MRPEWSPEWTGTESAGMQYILSNTLILLIIIKVIYIGIFKLIFSGAMGHVTCSRDINKSLPAHQQCSTTTTTTTATTQQQQHLRRPQRRLPQPRYAPGGGFFSFSILVSYFLFLLLVRLFLRPPPSHAVTQPRQHTPAGYPNRIKTPDTSTCLNRHDHYHYHGTW